MSTSIPVGEGWQLEENGADAYEHYLASAFLPWASELVALARVAEGDHVLDVACGTGIVARQAAPKAGAAGRVVGLDLNEEMLRVARAVSRGAAPPIEWRQGNADDLPFPSGTFDVVFCEQAVQFFSNPARAVAEMRRVLKDRGRAVASICRSVRHSPPYAALSRALERWIGPEAGAAMRSPFPDWPVEHVRALFRDAGFGRVSVRIEAVALRYPSCEEFLRREAASSPLSGPVRALSDVSRNGLISELRESLSDYVDDDGLVCPLEAYVIQASA